MNSESVGPVLLLVGGLLFSALSKRLKKKRAAAAQRAAAPLPHPSIHDTITPAPTPARRRVAPAPVQMAQPKPDALKPKQHSRLRQLIISDIILNRPQW